MALIDEFEGILGKKAIDNIKKNPKGFKDIVELYYGEEDDPPVTAAPVVAAPVAPVTTGFDLSAIESLLDKKLGNITDSVRKTTTDTVEEIITKRGAELSSNASAVALRNADELNRVYRRHEKEFGEDFDSTKFNEFVEGEMKNNHRFSSVTAAYEDWTKDRRQEKVIANAKDEGAREALKKKASDFVPGVTPPSARSPLSTFINRGRTTDSQGSTAVERAGESLARKLAASANE
jgi:hypothetical protein